MNRPADRLGVYVHIPFCAHRCGYCDFATWTDKEDLIEAYVDACVVDAGRNWDPGSAPADTVFFGGGTPSLIPAASLLRILHAIPRRAGAEVTVECNPDRVDPEKLTEYRTGGVTRISLGMQSVRPHVLGTLGRTHDPDGVARAVAWAREIGFTHVNVDVIYGTAGESMEDWRATLDAALALEVDHVSAYALTIEPSTPLGRAVATGTIDAPDDDDQAAKYLLADEMLTAANFVNYEISNWARAGGECAHNRDTWNQADYIAIGCAAHGHRSGRRVWNVRTPERYIAAIAAGRTPEAGSRVLRPDERAEERFQLALRTAAGAPLARPWSAAVATQLRDLERAGLVRSDWEHTGVVVLTARGRLVAGDLTARLLNAGAAPEWDAAFSRPTDPTSAPAERSPVAGTR